MKKIVSIILIGLLVFLVWQNPVCSPMGENMNGLVKDDVIYIWYTDEALASYLDNASISYYSQTGVHVQPVLVSGLGYLEKIHEETLHGANVPDLYIIGNESLETAVLSGLATPLKDSRHILNTSSFPQVSLDAVSYGGDYVGYPLCFETSVFLYNKTYLEAIAGREAERIAKEAASESAKQEGSETSEGEAENESEKLSPEDITPEKILPRSYVGILEFANSYDPPEGMEVFLKWDVTDIMYNYGFAGAYMDLGGSTGDDRGRLDLYNTNAMYALSIFQDFNQFFSIEAKEITYDSVIDEFIQGKVMFTFANTAVIEKLERAKEDGSLAFEYGIAPLEMLNTTLQARNLSVTDTVVVNGYGEQRELAEDFAAYLSSEYVTNLYARSGKMCAYKSVEYEYPQMAAVKDCYEMSVPIPKLVESGNYWVLAELCYTNIWEGEDVNRSLLALAQKINGQILGDEATELTSLPTPEVVESYISSE